MAAEFAAMGVTIPPEEIEPPAPVEVWSTHWPAVLVFLDCGTRWDCTVLPSGTVWHGLIYTEAEVVMRARGIAIADIFGDLQVMEREALGLLNAGG